MKHTDRHICRHTQTYR